MSFWCISCMRVTCVVFGRLPLWYHLCCVLFCVSYHFVFWCNLFKISFCVGCPGLCVVNLSRVLMGFLMYRLHAGNVGKGRKKEEQVQAKWYSSSSLCTQAHTHVFVKNHEHNISSYSIALATLFEDIVHCHLDLEAPRDDRWMHLDLETKLDGRKWQRYPLPVTLQPDPPSPCLRCKCDFKCG